MAINYGQMHEWTNTWNTKTGQTVSQTSASKAR